MHINYGLSIGTSLVLDYELDALLHDNLLVTPQFLSGYAVYAIRR
jgi:hypothetical protein